jgi:DNA-directed RNA polymerase specialized sigma24 family protein
MGSLTDAEDVLQEALLAAWRGLDGFEGRASLRSWLTSRCLNVLRDRGRRIPPEPQPSFHANGHHPIDRGPAVTDPDIGSWFITFPLRNRHEQQARHRSGVGLISNSSAASPTTTQPKASARHRPSATGS